ncbi:hypothetical protein HOY82DRAFT_596256 [Tuber indicum]|nr:hypothetical protein HOY82DRAFT_596256 [Tuber indicum]
MVQRKTTWGAKTIAATGEAMVAAMLKLGEQEKEIGRLRHHGKAREEKEEVAFGVALTTVAPPLEAVVPEPVVAEPSGAVVAFVASMEEVAEEVVEEVALVAPMDMELMEEEKVTEVQVSGEMLRVLREEEERKAGWKVVARNNKKRKVDEVVVAPLGPRAWVVEKGKTGKVVVGNRVLDVVPKGSRSLRQYMKVETGGRAARGLRIGPIASPIPKDPGAIKGVRITPYTSLPSVRPEAVRRIYKRGPLARTEKWNEVNPSTTQGVTRLQRCDIFGIGRK